MRASDQALLEQIQELLASDRSDRDLLAAFEAFGRDAGLERHIEVWAPALYARNPVRFRNFILGHVSSFLRWSDKLEGLLEAADRGNDVALFRRLFERKTQQAGWTKVEGLYREELRKRFEVATTPAARGVVLQKLAFEFSLDEPLALYLYENEPELAGPYIVPRLPYQSQDDTKLWETLFEKALARGDETFAFALYRDQAPYERWEKDAFALVRSDRAPTEIVAELEKRHARNAYFTNGAVWDELVRRHGEAVLSFVGEKASRTRWRNDLRDGLTDLAEANGWWGFWARMVRDASSAESYNARIERVLLDERLTDGERVERLRLVAGPRQDRHAQATPLTAGVTRLLYDKYPEVFRRDFRPQLSIYGRLEPELLDFFLGHNDAEMIDYFASHVARVVNYNYRNYREPPEPPPEAEQLVSHYRTLQNYDPKRFAARAARVLDQIQLFDSPRRIVERNPLARFLFGLEPEELLADPDAVQDLVETENVWVRAIGLRAIAASDERALAVTRKSFPLLLGMVLQVLTRDARRYLHRALSNLGAVDEDRAAATATQCRSALDMTPTSIPKDEVAQLLGELLCRWPALRTPRETLPIYERAQVSP